MPIGRTNQSRLMDTVLNKLINRILMDSLDNGSDGGTRLPTERRMAELLGVQRSTLREALATLENLGVLDRTQGRGTYLQLPDARIIQLYFDLALKLGYVTIEELEAAREMLEREIARRAAIVADETDIADLERLAERMSTAPSAEERVEADYRFHMRLARAAKNPVIVLITDGLSSVLRQVLQRRRHLVRKVPGAAVRMDGTHPPIVDALRRRDMEAATEAMDRHFSVWTEESSKISTVYGSTASAKT